MHKGEFSDGQQFTADNPAPEDEGWTLPQFELTSRIHPIHLIDAEAWLAWDLFGEYRGGGMGGGHLPEAGGSLDQAACTMASFSILAGAVEILRPKGR